MHNHKHSHTVATSCFSSSDILQCSCSNTITEAHWAVQHPSAVYRWWGYCSHNKSPVKSRSHWSDSAVAQRFTALWSVLAVPILKKKALIKAERKSWHFIPSSYLLIEKKEINDLLQQKCFLLWLEYIFSQTYLFTPLHFTVTCRFYIHNIWVVIKIWYIVIN